MSKANHAILAVTSISSWGLWAACRYARNHGVPCYIFLLVLRLEAQEQAKAQVSKLLPIFLQEQAQ